MFKKALTGTSSRGSALLKQALGRPMVKVLPTFVLPKREIFSSFKKLTNTVQSNAQIEKLKHAIETEAGAANEGIVMQYLKLLNQRSPKEAAQYIERGACRVAMLCYARIIHLLNISCTRLQTELNVPACYLLTLYLHLSHFYNIHCHVTLRHTQAGQIRRSQ